MPIMVRRDSTIFMETSALVDDRKQAFSGNFYDVVIRMVKFIPMMGVLETTALRSGCAPTATLGELWAMHLTMYIEG